MKPKTNAHPVIVEIQWIIPVKYHVKNSSDLTDLPHDLKQKLRKVFISVVFSTNAEWGHVDMKVTFYPADRVNIREETGRLNRVLREWERTKKKKTSRPSCGSTRTTTAKIKSHGNS